MHLSLNVGTTHVTGDLAKDLEIPEDPESLIEEIRKYPSMYCYWSTMAEVAKKEIEVTKNQYEVWHAERYLDVKRELMDEFGRSAVTESMVKARMLESYSEEIAQFEKAISDAEYRRSVLAIAANAFKEKGQAMINILSYKKQQLNDSGGR